MTDRTFFKACYYQNKDGKYQAAIAVHDLIEPEKSFVEVFDWIFETADEAQTKANQIVTRATEILGDQARMVS
jgi:hypothetical protein